MKICYGFCGSFCTMERSVGMLRRLREEGHELYPAASFNALNVDTRFGRASDFRKEIERICGRPVIDTIEKAEPVGPVLKPDLMIIAPLTGNSLAKLAAGISDTPVTLAAKAHLRAERPLLLCLATNDALGGNFGNLAQMYQKKRIYFLPMRQDDPVNKPRSLVCAFEMIPEAARAAANGRQLLPLFLCPA